MRPWFYAAGLEKLQARPRAKSQPIVSCKRRLVWLNNRIETKTITIKTKMNTQAVGSAYHHALAQEEQLEPLPHAGLHQTRAGARWAPPFHRDLGR